MALVKKKAKQTSIWVETTQLQAHTQHPFYSRVNEILEKAKFDLLCGTDLPEILRRADGAAVDHTRNLLPLFLHRLLRSIPSAGSLTGCRIRWACASS